MIVMKFGGTSVGNAEMIKRITNIVKSQTHRNPIVVVSAFDGVTDGLIKIANDASNGRVNLDEIRARHFDVIKNLELGPSVIPTELKELEILLTGISILKELTPRTLDAVMSFGERMSARIIATYMSKAGLDARAYNSYDLGLVTDSKFGNAEVLPETAVNIRNYFKKLKCSIPVITGFIAKSKNGEITTLGRGGSDYTASIVGAALDAEEIQIWTDVNGIMTADPKIIEDAVTVELISYEEASELAFLGAKLHPKTILPAINKNIPVRVLNTFNPSSKGTTILRNARTANRVTSIVCRRNVKVVNIHSPRMLLAHGFLHKISEVFDRLGISVDMISTSEVNVSLTIDDKYSTERLVEELKNIGDVEVRNNRASISLVGSDVGGNSDILGRVFANLGAMNIDIEMLSSGASEINESFVVREEDADDAVKTLHNALFGDACE
jgi:aspartate kinase